jgi:Asp-tRNA(Asn)/Glu-tRNA(Gln) amidotransferase A subunit family amidase
MEPCFLTAAEAAGHIRAKTLTCEELVRSCLRRIEERDADVRAFIHLDPARAIAKSRELDKRPPLGPLHGLPLAVKDMIDTGDMPTTHNSPLYQGHQPAKDAGCVAVVRHNGALILGKTDTVEFASGGRKALTRNPHNLAHTPGGSSSGSGAAVGDFMVPLAFGTQTGGSHIRPASFNGIYGLKPTWSTVTREGAKMLSPMCDTVGWYGRSVADLQLVAEAFRIFSPAAEKPVETSQLRVAVVQTPYWERIEPAGREALAIAAKRLQQAGAKVEDLTLPQQFGSTFEAQETIMHGEGAAAFLPELLAHGDRLHPESSRTGRKFTEGDGASHGCSSRSCRGLPQDIRRLLQQLRRCLDPVCAGRGACGTAHDWRLGIQRVLDRLARPVSCRPLHQGKQGAAGWHPDHRSALWRCALAPDCGDCGGCGGCRAAQKIAENST